MQTTANAVAGGVPAQRLEFKYDYLHRRIEKLVRGGWNGSVFTTVTVQKRFLYDGWSLIAEYSVSGSTLGLVRSYTWGLDIAKSLTDAGGVGALLQIHDYSGSGKDYLPSYDGNGNIAALFDTDASSSGTAGAAAYEYSPYGESLRCEGTYAKENPFRFSTKFIDDETGLVYYGRRYYSPSQGRFLGRDPSGEAGGLHLYGFTSNNPVNRWDYLGMYVILPNSDGNGNNTWDLFDDTDSGNVFIYNFATREAAEQAMSQMGVNSPGIDFAALDAQNQLVSSALLDLGGATVWEPGSSTTLLGGAAPSTNAANPIAAIRGTSAAPLTSNTLSTGVNLNLMGDRASSGMNAIVHTSGTYAIIVDGTGNQVQLPGGRWVGASDFASMLVNSPNSNYLPGTPILLISCETGTATTSPSGNFAQQLADLVHAPVVAPTTFVNISNTPNTPVIASPGLTYGDPGQITIAPILKNPDGTWFKAPDGTAEQDLNNPGKFQAFYPGH